MECILYAVQDGENNIQVTGPPRNNEIGSNSSSRPVSTPEGISSPASLAEVLLSTRQMFVEQASECLLVRSRTSIHLSIFPLCWNTGPLTIKRRKEMLFFSFCAFISKYLCMSHYIMQCLEMCCEFIIYFHSNLQASWRIKLMSPIPC